MKTLLVILLVSLCVFGQTLRADGDAPEDNPTDTIAPPPVDNNPPDSSGFPAPEPSNGDDSSGSPD